MAVPPRDLRVPAVSAADDAFAELVTLTGLSAQEWQDVLSLPPVGQQLALRAYRDADWRTSPDTFQKVLDVLGVIGQIAGVVGGVAGAAGAVAALRNL